MIKVNMDTKEIKKEQLKEFIEPFDGQGIKFIDVNTGEEIKGVSNAN